jgi:hypothetical protein
MKFSIQKLLTSATSIFLIAATSSQAGITATTTEFSAPAEYCFPQTSLRSEFGKFDKVILDHRLIIRKEDHFKTGDIFVGFRRKSQPDVLWLTDGVSWQNAADDSDTPRAFPIYAPNNSDGKLQPIMSITLSNEPTDVSAYIGDGEIWTGYGLRAEGETWKESFEDMMSNQRFEKIWEITGFTPAIGLQGTQPTICLTTTGMKEIVLTVDAFAKP